MTLPASPSSGSSPDSGPSGSGPSSPPPRPASASGPAVDGLDQVRDRAVVRLTDATFRDGVAELRWRLRDQILSGVRVLVVDVSAVRQLSSTAVAALLGAHRSCRARGGGVIIRNPNRRTLDLLRRTGLWRVLRPEFTEVTELTELTEFTEFIDFTGSTGAEREQRAGRRTESH